MDYSDAFRLVNLAVGCVHGPWWNIPILPLRLSFQIPPQVSRYASFLFSFVGRGIFYVFVGSILLHDHVLRIIAGSLIGIIGSYLYCP
ncbi:hypothetical protein EYC84_000287 [Monilinia fructicola]|uniref:Uncharacterized protein n=1 Tax=Monilinia fructicola TaxID=38448 RepID=A0A5M9JSX7_MONFR|nr:hypothetical protein EYC84_000287 [Monilinia fructicola]